MASSQNTDDASFSSLSSTDHDLHCKMIRAVIQCDNLEQTRHLDFWATFSEENEFIKRPAKLLDIFWNKVIPSISSYEEIAQADRTYLMNATFSEISCEGEEQLLPSPDDMKLHGKMLKYVYARKGIDLARNVRFWKEFADECGVDENPFDLKCWFWGFVVKNAGMNENLNAEERRFFARGDYIMTAPFDFTEIRENKDIVIEQFQKAPIHTRAVITKRAPRPISRLLKENPSECQDNLPLKIIPFKGAMINMKIELPDGTKTKVPPKSYFKERDEFTKGICEGILRPEKVQREEFYSISRLKNVFKDMIANGIHPGDDANKNTWQYYALNGLPIPTEFKMDEFNVF